MMDRYDKLTVSDDYLASSILTRPRSCRCWLMLHPPSSTQKSAGQQNYDQHRNEEDMPAALGTIGTPIVKWVRLLIGISHLIPVISVFCRHQAPYIGHYLIKGYSNMTVL